MQIISTKSDISNHSILSVYFNQLVIGSTKDAVQFAYNNRYKLISCNDRKPEEFDPDLDDWQETLALLSLGGLMPFSDRAETLTYNEEDGTITLLTKEENRYTIYYKELYVFDLENLNNFFFLDKTNCKDIVLDYLKTKKGRHHSTKLKEITREGEHHISQIINYQNSKSFHPLVISHLPADHYKLEDYSENITRLLVQRILRSHLGTDDLSVSWESRKVIPLYDIKKLDGCPTNIKTYEDIVETSNKTYFDMIDYIKYFLEVRWQNKSIT
jgi:hypothetical protein